MERERERDHCSIPQATWPKIFESPLARLPGCPPFTHLKGRQNRILRARPRLFATVVIANKKWLWFSKQWFGQMIIHPSLLPSKLWGSCCSHIFCIGQETSQTEPLPKVMDFNKSKTSGGQSNWCSNVCRTLMKKARPWHLFRHFSTKRYFSQRHLLSLLLDRISGSHGGGTWTSASLLGESSCEAFRQRFMSAECGELTPLRKIILQLQTWTGLYRNLWPPAPALLLRFVRPGHTMLPWCWQTIILFITGQLVVQPPSWNIAD